MVFGKKSKNEIQYYVDQIDRLKEENASLNARITDQSAELEHYKAFFNSNSKLLEASNRMNIACVDIQDAFDILVAHAEAIRFPDHIVNSNSLVEESSVEPSSVDIESNETSGVIQNTTTNKDVIKDSFSEFFEENDNLSENYSTKTGETENKTFEVHDSVIPKNRFSDNIVKNDETETNIDVPEKPAQEEVFLEEEPLFEIENTPNDIKSNNMISGGYATKSEMIAGHVDSLFAMDDQDQENNKPDMTKSDVVLPEDQQAKKEVVFETDNLFEESQMVDENVTFIDVDNSQTNLNAVNNTTIMTETELIDIESISSTNSESGVQSLSSNNQLNTTYHTDADKGADGSFDDSKSHLSANVNKLFDEEYLDSDETKPVFRKDKEDLKDLFLKEESLSDSQPVTKSGQDVFDVKPSFESDDRSQDDTNNYVFESTPKGQHISFDEPIADSSTNKDNKGDSSTETSGIFEIDDILENNDTDVFTEVTDLNESKMESSHQNHVDDNSNPVSEVRSRIASIDFHEEIAWIKPKKNPRKRKFSYLTRD